MSMSKVGDQTGKLAGHSNEKAGVDPFPVLVGGAENPLPSGSSLTTTTAGGESGVAAASRARARRSVSKDDRDLANGLKHISQVADGINLTRRVVERANTLFKMIHHGKKLQSRSNYGIGSACLFIACRQESVTRSLHEIFAAAKTKNSMKEIGRCYQGILKAVDNPVDLVITMNFMYRYCRELGLGHINSVEKPAIAIARAAVDLGIVSGSSPFPVVGAALYMASQASEKKRSTKEIGNAVCIPEATILKYYKLMYPRAEELFPKDFEFVTPIGQLPVA